MLSIEMYLESRLPLLLLDSVPLFAVYNQPFFLKLLFFVYLLTKYDLLSAAFSQLCLP